MTPPHPFSWTPPTVKLAKVILALSPVVAAILLCFQPTTYGKLDGGVQKHHWLGPLLPSKYSWMVFESPCWMWVVVVTYCIVRDGIAVPLPNLILLAWFLVHYIHRSILYPLQVSTASKMPLGISLFAFCYTFCNGYIQAVDLVYQQKFPQSYAESWQFQFGAALTFVGFGIAYQSDHILLRLKKQKDGEKGGYRIPHGGMFRYVSSPHYLGELIEWTGFCIACNFSLASISFVVWTAANLVPRARSTHLWYQTKFREDYTDLNRKAILPFIY